MLGALQTITTEPAQTCAWGSPWAIPASFALFMLASLAHEAVHVVGIYPIAEEIRVEASDIYLGDLEVEAEIKDEEWRHKWADTVGVLPLVVGLFIGVLVLSTGSVTFERFINFGIAFAWVVFTFAGGASDFSRGASKAAGELGGQPVADGGQTRLPAVLAKAGQYPKLKRMAAWSLVTFAIGVGYTGSCHGLWGYLGLGLMFGGIMLFARVAAEVEKRGLKSE